MSDFGRGDRVIFVRKVEPTQSGALLFELTRKEFPVCLEDIRLKPDLAILWRSIPLSSQSPHWPVVYRQLTQLLRDQTNFVGFSHAKRRNMWCI